MALQATSRPGYVKTGEDGQSGWGAAFARWSNTASYVPYFGAPFAWALGMIGTAIESVSYLFKGQILSAGTALATGTVASTVNSAASAGGVTSPLYWGNAASGIITGRTAGSHARMVTEQGIGLVTGALGVKPTVLRANFAAVGGIDGLSAPQRPGQFASAESARRGVDANEQYANYMRGEGGVHVNELGSAAGRA